jgi:hypothetical protein
MNEQLETALSELITKTTTGIDTASDFILAELPDVIRQMLVWHGVYNFILFICGILWVVSICVIVRKGYLYGKGKFLNDGVDYCLYTLLSGIATFIPTSLMLNVVWLQIWVAPKVWLIEYAANLVK